MAGSCRQPINEPVLNCVFWTKFKNMSRSLCHFILLLMFLIHFCGGKHTDKIPM